MEAESKNEQYPAYVNLTQWLKKETDIPATVIITWLRSRNTLAFLREWEKYNNPDFDESGYWELLTEKGRTGTAKMWYERTDAIGITSRQSNNGGVSAHPVIAADFKMWHSPALRYFFVDALTNWSSKAEYKGEPKVLEKRVYFIPPKNEWR